MSNAPASPIRDRQDYEQKLKAVHSIPGLEKIADAVEAAEKAIHSDHLLSADDLLGKDIAAGLRQALALGVAFRQPELTGTIAGIIANVIYFRTKEGLINPDGANTK